MKETLNEQMYYYDAKAVIFISTHYAVIYNESSHLIFPKLLVENLTFSLSCMEKITISKINSKNNKIRLNWRPNRLGGRGT